jgi:hypothetical protein
MRRIEESGPSVGAPSALQRLEHEISETLREHHEAIVHEIAVTLVTIAVHERAVKNGNTAPPGPRLCSVCRARLAADQRRVCHSCRRRQRNERERLREAHAAELERVAAGERGERAQAIVLGERQSASF